jgi:hypothetical protein
MSLMRRHQQQIATGAEPQHPAGGTRVLGAMPAGLMGGNQLGTMLLASLQQDLAALKEIASKERKAAFKADVLLPKYADHVHRLMAAGQPHELIGWYLVWCFDSGRIEEGLQVAAWAQEHGQPLPERFSSSLELFVASQTLEWAEAQYNADHEFEPYLTQAQAMLAESDIPDTVRAGFHRIAGLQAEREDNLPEAEAQLARAYELGAKVKTALEAVRKRLARQETD